MPCLLQAAEVELDLGVSARYLYLTSCSGHL